MTENVTLKDIYDAVSGLREDIAANYVTKDAFEPVRNLVYGLVTVILISFVGAVLTLVYHNNTTSSSKTTTVTTQTK